MSGDSREIVELVKTSPVHSTCAEHTFLFVHESATGGAGKKIGNRKDLRSHVRRHIKVNNGNDGNETSAKKRTAVPVREKRRGNRGSSSMVLSRGQPIRVEDVSDHPGRESSIRTATRVEQAFQSPEFEAFDSLSESPVLSSATGSITSDDAKESHLYCLHCGAHRDDGRPERVVHTERQASQGLALTRDSRSRLFAPSPVGKLGAGRVNPFSQFSGAAPQIHEGLDHFMSYVLPGLHAETAKTKQTISSTWFSKVDNPLLFHTVVLCGAAHLDFIRRGKIYPESQLVLGQKLRVINAIKLLLGDLRTGASQDLAIFAVTTLAIFDMQDLVHEENDPFNSPLRKVGWLNVYGCPLADPKHPNVMAGLVAKRGGLDKMELPGLSLGFRSYNVTLATRNLTKPVLPPSDESNERLNYLLQYPASLLRPLRDPKIATGFWYYLDEGVSPDMVSVFDQAGALTLAIQLHIDGDAEAFSLAIFTSMRNDVQGRILSLPCAIDIPHTAYPLVYEASRLTGIIYSIAVILPIPNAYQVFRALIQRLQIAIQMSDMERLDWRYRDLHLWHLILGGIAALDKPERLWYVEQLAAFATTLGIWEWNVVSGVMEKFLWFESACGSGGRKLWGEVLEMGRVVEVLE